MRVKLVGSVAEPDNLEQVTYRNKGTWEKEERDERDHPHRDRFCFRFPR